MPTPSETIATNVIGQLDPTFNAGQLTEIDPFNALTPPPSTLGNYDYTTLDAGNVSAFMQGVSMTSGPTNPNAGTLANGNLAPTKPGGDLTANIPQVQHSVWVGATLGSQPPPGTKHQAVMDALAKNKRENPDWQVNLWTDVPRAALHNAVPGSPEANLLVWAQTNGVNLVNIDEVFSGNNPMTLGEQFKMEQYKGGTGFAAASDIARLNVVQRFGGIYVDADKSIANFNEVAKAANRVGGMGCASEGGRYQNCGFCSEKGHASTQAILDRVEAKYGMTRVQVNNGGTHPVLLANGNTIDVPGDNARVGRAEIINRTGPTAFREALRTPANNTANQLPDGMVDATVYTTSWTADIKLGAQKNLQAEWGNMPGVMPTAANLKLAGTNAADNLTLAAPTLPGANTLTGAEQLAIEEAVKKGVTVLAYTSQNEGGRLDMNHCKSVLKGLPEAHRTIAMDAIVRTFGDPAMQGTADKVGCIILPTNTPGATNNIPIATETLDTLFGAGGPPFVNAPMINGTVQNAALTGDLRTLKYAVDYGHLDGTTLDVPSVYSLEAGKHNTDHIAKRMDVMTAAIYGGNHEALGYLLSQGNANATHLETAAKLGAVTPMLVLMDDGVAPNQGTAETLKDYHNSMNPNTLNADLGLGDASGIRQNGTIALLNKHQALGNVGATKQVAIDQVAEGALFKADLEILSHMNTQLGATPAEIRAKLSPIDLPREASLGRLGAIATQPADMALVLDIADTAANKLAVQNGALQAGNLDMANAYLNQQRGPMAQIDLAAGAHDAEAVSAISHARYPDVEAIKNDWQGVNVGALTQAEAQELVLKGLAYSETRQAAGHTGRASRVQGWSNLMDQIDNQFPALGAQRLSQACAQSDHSLTQLQGARQSVRETLGRSLERTKAALGVGGHGHGH